MLGQLARLATLATFASFTALLTLSTFKLRTCRAWPSFEIELSLDDTLSTGCELGLLILLTLLDALRAYVAYAPFGCEVCRVWLVRWLCEKLLSFSCSPIFSIRSRLERLESRSVSCRAVLHS